MPWGGLNKMTCGLSQGLQDISSSFTSVKDELNAKMKDLAAEEFPALGKGIGANISTMKADMETAMADLKAKADLVIPEISVQLPNLQTAAEEGANLLKAAAAEINPVSIAALQEQAAAKFEEIRTSWGSTATPGVNIEQVISNVGENFSSMDFCTAVPNMDLKTIGVDEGTGIPIYETIKKGITANTSTTDTTEPKKAVDKKKIETVKPALVASGADGTPVNTAKSDPNPKPTTAMQTSNKPESVPAAPKPMPKVTGAIQSKTGHQNVMLSEVIEFECMFVPRKDDEGYMWWAPIGYDNQFEYEKAWAISVMNARIQTANRIAYWQKRIDNNDSGSKFNIDHPYNFKVAALIFRLRQLNKIKFLGGQSVAIRIAASNLKPGDQRLGIQWWRFDDPKEWDEITDCPKPLHDGPGTHPGAAGSTVDLDLFGMPSKKGYEYMPMPGAEDFDPTKPSWDISTGKWVWRSKARSPENTTSSAKILAAGDPLGAG